VYLVVFDCDGTLVDSQHAIIAATEYALTRANLPIPERKKILNAVGLPLDAALQRHAPDADADLLAKIVEDYREESVRLAQHDTRGQIMFPGMRDLIVGLGQEKQVRLGMVTMKSRRGVERVVDAYDIRPFFHALKSADDGPGKPAPDLLLEAMRELDIPASRTMMIGDTSFDMLMARAAGTYAIGVSWGYQTVEELEESGAHEIVASPEELAQSIHMFIS